MLPRTNVASGVHQRSRVAKSHDGRFWLGLGHVRDLINGSSLDVAIEGGVLAKVEKRRRLGESLIWDCQYFCVRPVSVMSSRISR